MPTSGRLVFRATLPASARLIFRPAESGPAATGLIAGAVPGPSGGFVGQFRYQAATGLIAARVPAPRGAWSSRYVVAAGEIAGQLPHPAGEFDGDVFPRVWRGPSAMGLCGLAKGRPQAGGAQIAVSRGRPVGLAADLAWTAGRRTSGAARVSWATAGPIGQTLRLAMGPGSWLGGAAAVPWGITDPVGTATRLGIDPATGLRANCRAVWGVTERAWIQAATPWHTTRPLGTVLIVPWRPSLRPCRHWDIRWGPGQAPSYGVRPVAPPLVPGQPYQPAAHLVFRAQLPASPHLVFRRATRTRSLPLREFYSVHNTAYLKRVSDDEPIECRSLRIGGDWQSWGRRFSGELFYSERSKLDLNNGPIEIEIGANGAVWRALVRSVRPARKFGGDSLAFEAVSLSAELAAPYAAARSRTNTEALTAQQIALQELDGTGWALDWQIVDWLVPAGAYSVQQATPMQALQYLAEAVGGYVQTDRTSRIIRVLPRFPVLPWHWGTATPDVVLPADVFESLGSDWVEKPAYDGVYVSGQGHGVNALVILDGAAGTNLAPMVVEALLTEQDANRARGEAILADTGTQSTETVALALPEDIGVVEPGALVRITEGGTSWTALARGVDIDIAWRGDEGLAVWQTVTLERHYGG